MGVKVMVKRFQLDKGAATKLEEAMAMREAMGKNVDKDLELLAEHLEASNKPSALVSMKLDSLRKGFNVGHCIYSREAPLPGNQAPGIEGVFDKRDRRKGRGMGYTDEELDRRFASQAENLPGVQLMDEETARRLVAAERQEYESKLKENRSGKSDRRRRSHSQGRSESRSRRRSRSRERLHGREQSSHARLEKRDRKR